MNEKSTETLFASAPRRPGRAGPLLIAFCAVLTLAFLAEVAPSRAPEERLYELYASADAYARSAAEARRRTERVAAADAPASPRVLARVAPVWTPAIGAFPMAARDCSCP